MEREAIIDKLISHYSENFELGRNVDIAGITVPVTAVMRHRSEVSILGFNTGKKGSEACECLFMLESESFDEDLFKIIFALIEEAGREYVRPGKDHAYTFLSVVAVVAKADAQAVKLLKKYKYRMDYGKGGWVISRIVVFDENGECFCNKDGSDLKRLILTII